MKTDYETEASGVRGEGWVFILMFIFSIAVLFGIWFWGYRQACKDLEKRMNMNQNPIVIMLPPAEKRINNDNDTLYVLDTIYPPNGYLITEIE